MIIAGILEYLRLYTDTFDLKRYIRFNTLVTHLYQSGATTRKWTIESIKEGSTQDEEFDFVSVSNGHYSDVWIPRIPGLSSFPEEVLHSRYYRRPEDYTGKTVLVVGSYASGSDLSRQLASLNIGKYASTGQKLSEEGTLTPETESDESFTKVYISSSSVPEDKPTPPEFPAQPWKPFIHHVPLVSHISPPSPAHPRGAVHFKDDREVVDDIDVIIFATGYNFSLPFCKAKDQPWATKPVLDGIISDEERVGGRESDIGGLKGLGMKNLDELMLFLDGDRSIAFPVLRKSCNR